MKTARNQALTLLADEIVEEGKATDQDGRPLYPVIQEPLVSTLFGAPEALLEVLKERPGVILNLIQINKRLEAFLNHFEGLWIALIDTLVEDLTTTKEFYGFLQSNRSERAGGADASFGVTYPFFAVTNYRIYQLQRTLAPMVPAYEPTGFMRRVWDYSKLLLDENTRVGRLYYAPELRYLLVYYDPVTKMFIELLQRISFLDSFFSQPVDAESILKGYLVGLGALPAIRARYATHLCLPDAFLVVEGFFRPFRYEVLSMNTYVQDIAEKYEPYRHGPLVSNEVEVTIEVERRREIVGLYPLAAVQSLAEILRLLSRLQGMLRRHREGIAPIIQEEAQALLLDKNTTRPFRDLLYDKEQGLYNTQEKQKHLFIALLKEAAAEYDSTGEARKRYGDLIPLACTVCHRETYSVDPLLKRAFCTEACRGSLSF